MKYKSTNTIQILTKCTERAASEKYFKEQNAICLHVNNNIIKKKQIQLFFFACVEMRSIYQARETICKTSTPIKYANIMLGSVSLI